MLNKLKEFATISIILLILFSQNLLIAVLPQEVVLFKKNYFKALSRVPENNNKRVGSYPYITGDTFRKIADHIYDETDIVFQPSKVNNGDVVFVNTHFLDLFIKFEFDLIKNNFILITHNSNISCPKNYLWVLENDKIIAWFGNNPDCKHRKFKALPLGISNLHWPHGNIDVIDSILLNLKKDKKQLLISNFCIDTNVLTRKEAYDAFLKSNYCFFAPRKDYDGYMKDLYFSKFCLNPFGSGQDCHRLWEALLMGCYPITKSSELDCLYEDLPVVVIENWFDVSEDYLNKKYLEFSASHFMTQKLYFDYWKELIFKVKNDYIEGLK